MRFIYIDETIHRDLGFMLLSFVICDKNPQDAIEKILLSYGLPEFHSADKMKNNNNAQEVRTELISYINYNCKWGVFLTNEQNRHFLEGDFCALISNLKEILPNETIKVFVDEGIINKNIETRINSKSDPISVDICKSNIVAGIQLADLVAALCGIRLKSEISGEDKFLEYGSESGFSPPISAPLSYELWASLRYSMLHSGNVLENEQKENSTSFNAHNYGFIISSDCSKEFITASEKIFGSVYLGCIH